MDLGPHAIFIWVSYIAVAIVTGGLIAWLFYDGNRLARMFEDIEKRGLARRAKRQDRE